MPAQKNLDVWPGNTKAQTFRFRSAAGVPLDLTGSTLVFRARWTDAGGVEQSLRKVGPSADFAIDTPTSGEATLNFTVAETRAFPTGASAKYELELRSGSAQETLLYGYLVAAVPWANDDV